MYSNTILKLDLIIIIIQKYCEKYLKPDKDISDINKSKTIKFVLDQLSDIRKTKDFKVLKSIFTIEKKQKIKDLKDWLNILCANNFKLFSKHFKLDVEIDMTKGYKTYVNLLSKLENNKTKVDLKEPNKKISILFNLLFYDVIVGGVVKKREKKRYASTKAHRKPVAHRLKNREKTKEEYKLYPIARQVKISSSIVKSFQNSYDLFRNSVIDANKQKPKTILNIVALMEAAQKYTESARLGPLARIRCPAQQERHGTCWIISVIAALVYPSNMSEILEYICGIELLKLSDKELDEGSIKAIILSRFRLLYTFRKYDRILTHINTKAYSIHYEFIKDFIEAIFRIDQNFFNKGYSINIDDFLQDGGSHKDREIVIKNILEQAFNFELVAKDDKTYFYQYTDPRGHIFKLVTTDHLNFRQKYQPSGYKIASYIVRANAIHTAERAESETLSHSVAVVKINGLNLHCNGWCDPNIGCMAEEVVNGRIFGLVTDGIHLVFNTDDESTLLIAYDAKFNVNKDQIEELFKEQLEQGKRDEEAQRIANDIETVINSMESDLLGSMDSIGSMESMEMEEHNESSSSND
jgi:hypothetical protein